jgi:aldose 1-epimerase
MKPRRIVVTTLLVNFVLIAFATVTLAQSKPTKEGFGETADGQKVDLYTLTNRNGVEAKIITYGATLVSLKVPDRNNHLDDVVLGLSSLDDYIKGTSYLGAIVGRYGNRIAKGRFTLGGVEYKLAVNNGENHLHGGIKGFDKVVWNAREMSTKNGPALQLTYLSKDGEEGYPGNLKVTVTYTITNRNELRIDYSAATDKDTVLNLTHHSYFNLAGEGNGDILNHQVTINALKFTPTDEGSIPTGELRSVRGTPFDFTRATAIGARINQSDQQLQFGKGYDHNWVLNGRMGVLRQAATAYEPTTGRFMQVWTTEPGVQFYTGNFLDGTLIGRSGKPYQYRYGFCFETQHYPDSPNHPSFPTTTLKKGATYHSTTIYRFSTRKG